jgi:hypothetical protein
VIAALYVATSGCYYGLPDVDPWDQARDARLYTRLWRIRRASGGAATGSAARAPRFDG